MDKILVKSKIAGDHIEHLIQMFNILQKYWMKLNPLKYAFGVVLGKFLGFTINQHGIKANPKKINAFL